MADPQLIVNPFTPLAFLPPDLANQFEASRYLYAATLGAFIWDWLMSIPEEYLLITKIGLVANRAFPVLVYFFSRVFALAYIVTSLIFQVAPVANCQALELVNTICYCLTVSSASYLFYLRAQAVFHQNRWIQIGFGILWVAVSVGTISVPLAVKGSHIGPTQYCVNAEVKSFSSVAVILSTIFDSLVFSAISFKLMTDSEKKTLKDRIKALIRGNGLSSISKSLFKGGQVYYLTTVGMNLLTLIMVLTPSAPPVYRAMFTIPNNALQNVMTCRVFRQLRLGIIPTSEPTRSGTGIALSWRPSNMAASFQIPDLPAHQAQKYETHLNPFGGGAMDFKVTQDVEVDRSDSTEISKYDNTHDI